MRIHKVTFPEVSNAQINIALVADKLNELIEEVNEINFPSRYRAKFNIPDGIGTEPPKDQPTFSTPEIEITKTGTLKPGVQVTKNGKYYLKGKGFIKKVDAFL